MNIKIFCRSKTGNTLKVAKELASTAEAFLSSAARPAGSVTVDCGSSDGPSIVRFSDSDRGRTDLLFLGAAVYATEDHDILPEVQAFIGTLDASNTAAVALFATGFSTAALATATLASAASRWASRAGSSATLSCACNWRTAASALASVARA